MSSLPKTSGPRNPAPPPPQAPSPPDSASRKGLLVPLLVFTAIFAVLLFPLISREVEPRWDARDMTYPSFAYAADSFAEGRLPLWDPYSDCGYPFHAEPGTPAWNPLTPLLHALLPDTGAGFVFFWLIHWWWGGAGMLRWAKYRGAGTGGALAAATAYAFSGYFVGHASHTSFIVLAGWLPWLFQLSEAAVDSGRTDRALVAGAAFGYACLSGYPGLMTFAGLGLALWLASRYLVDRPDDGLSAGFARRAIPIAKTLGIVGVVGIAVWSPALHAFFVEGGGYTERVGQLPPETANFLGPFPPSAFFSLLFPFASILAKAAIPTDITMANGYVGILAIPVAATWFLCSAGRRRPWGFAAFVLFMFLVSVGGHAGLRSVLYYVFPPMRFMRFSAPFRIFWILPLCLALGQGISLMASMPKARTVALKAMAAWGVAAVAAAILLERFLASVGSDIPGTATTIYGPAALAFLLALPLLFLWSREAPGKHAALLPSLLATVACGDMALHLLNNNSTVWSPGDTIRQAESMHRPSTAIDGDPGPRLPPLPYGFYNAHLVLKTPVSKSYVTMLSKGFDEGLAAKDSRFLEVLQGSPRFWLSPGTATAPAREAALAVLERTGAADNVPVFVEGATPDPARGSVVPGSYGAVLIRRYAPERVELTAEVPGKDGAFLASTERITAGWRVTVDGVPGTPVRTNLYFRGVSLPPGTHSVIWEYRPSGLYPLVVLSVLTLLLAASAPYSARWLGKFRKRETAAP